MDDIHASRSVRRRLIQTITFESLFQAKTAAFDRILIKNFRRKSLVKISWKSCGNLSTTRPVHSRPLPFDSSLTIPQ